MSDKTKITGEIPYEVSEAQRIDFCKEWPCAKRALEALRDLINVAFIKAIIDIVIKAGDEISGKICKK